MEVLRLTVALVSAPSEQRPAHHPGYRRRSRGYGELAGNKPRLRAHAVATVGLRLASPSVSKARKGRNGSMKRPCYWAGGSPRSGRSMLCSASRHSVAVASGRNQGWIALCTSRAGAMSPPAASKITLRTKSERSAARQRATRSPKAWPAKHMHCSAIERFDDPSHICSEGMQRDAFQRTSAFASPARIHRDSAKATPGEAPGKVVEIACIKAPLESTRPFPRSVRGNTIMASPTSPLPFDCMQYPPFGKVTPNALRFSGRCERTPDVCLDHGAATHRWPPVHCHRM
jgi:hypothetical protein